MRSTSGYSSILQQLQPRDSKAPITRGLPNVIELARTKCIMGNNACALNWFVHELCSQLDLDFINAFDPLILSSVLTTN